MAFIIKFTRALAAGPSAVGDGEGGRRREPEALGSSKVEF